MASPESPAVDHAALFEAAPTPYLVVDTDLIIVEADRAFCMVARRGREDLVGRNLFEAFRATPPDPNGDGVENLRASPHRAA